MRYSDDVIVGTTSANEIYDYFLARRNGYLVAEAGKMIAQMKTDIAKDLVPLISASSKQEVSVALLLLLLLLLLFACRLLRRLCSSSSTSSSSSSPF